MKEGVGLKAKCSDCGSREICRSCKSAVYHCPDPACECWHHCSHESHGTEPGIECDIEDIPHEMVIAIRPRV